MLGGHGGLAVQISFCSTSRAAGDKWARPAVGPYRGWALAIFHSEVFEHGLFKRLPGEIRIADATHGPLHDTGVGGMEAA